MKKHHTIKNIKFSARYLTMEIDGQTKKFDIEAASTALSRASRIEKETFEISPSGYGIHWPMLDEDITIDGLLGMVHKPEQEAESGQASSQQS